MHSDTDLIRRFFLAIDYLIQAKEITGLTEFCERGKFNRTKYQKMRTQSDPRYTKIELRAFAFLAAEFRIRSEWLLLGKGKMR